MYNYALLKIAAKAFVWVCKNKKQPPLLGGCVFLLAWLQKFSFY